MGTRTATRKEAMAKRRRTERQRILRRLVSPPQLLSRRQMKTMKGGVTGAASRRTTPPIPPATALPTCHARRTFLIFLRRFLMKRLGRTLACSGQRRRSRARNCQSDRERNGRAHGAGTLTRPVKLCPFRPRLPLALFSFNPFFTLPPLCFSQSRLSPRCPTRPTRAISLQGH